MEGFKQSRTKVVYEAQVWSKLTEREKIAIMPIAETYNYDLTKCVKALNEEIKDEKGKPIIKDSRIGTIRKHTELYRLIYSQNIKSESFANWYYENRLLGYNHGISLKDIFDEKTDNLVSIRDVENSAIGSSSTFIGTVFEKPHVGKTKKGNSMFRVSISDDTGIMKVLMFNDKLNTCKSQNGDKYPEEGNIVIIKGKKVEEAVFADLMSVQDSHVYTKLSEVRN